MLKKIFKNNTKKIILLTSIILIVLVSVGVTISYLVDNSNSLVNTFTDANVTNEVKETFENNVKTDVYVTNTGDITSYIRALIVVTYQDGNGNVYGEVPVSNLENSSDYDYTLVLGSDTGWIKGSDGYYYYIYPVEPKVDTGLLIEEAYPSDNQTPEGYGLSIEIMASSIQSEPSTVVTKEWNTGVSAVSEDGTLSVK